MDSVTMAMIAPLGDLQEQVRDRLSSLFLISLCGRLGVKDDSLAQKPIHSSRFKFERLSACKAYPEHRNQEFKIIKYPVNPSLRRDFYKGNKVVVVVTAIEYFREGTTNR